MKVLHLLDSINRGGAEILALDVCRHARAQGIDLTFVTAKGGALEADFRASGAEFYRLNRRLPLDFNLILKLRKIIRRSGIRIVHGHQPVDGLHLQLATVGLPAVKRVLSFHSFISDAKNRRTAQILIPQTDANVVVSRALQKWLSARDGLDTDKNFRVLYNGVDEARLRPTGGKSLRAELNLDEDAVLLGMIGNFYRDPRKDQLTVCRALPKVFAEIRNAHCIFVGRAAEEGREAEGKLEACVRFCREHQIADRVHFLGARADVPDVLAALDLFVFSSLHEGLPIAVNEAMLANVPMIVSDIEPLLEATDNGTYAEVFHAQDAVELSRKILRLLKDEAAREKMAHAAREFARANFSIEAHLLRLRELYESLLEQ